jgi:predicted DNA-binding transcriptional regulator AlpA
MPAKSAHPLASGTASSVKSPLLTARQVMELLGCSRTALWMLMRTQGLPYIKLGDSRRPALLE